jgi:putative salt-induced outer membrane protein|tara:strand:+ start:23658 stop:24479 length:822 start_codon:yes stop_codon:yes gene_type:complete
MPQPIEQMIRAASPAERATVAKVAKRTAASSAEEIDQLVASLVAEETRAERERLASQSFLDGWAGQGGVGGTYSTGNTREIGGNASLALSKRSLAWEHDINVQFDYLKSNGQTRRERIYAGYTGRRDFGGSFFFSFGLLSFERDRFSGIDSRFTESLGIGYRLADTGNFQWTLEGGPAARQTQFTDGRDLSRVDLLGRTDIDWKLSSDLRLTESAGFLLSGENSSLYSKTAITTTIFGDLSARLSYDVLHETDPPEGRQKTDTITRASLVYGF